MEMVSRLLDFQLRDEVVYNYLDPSWSLQKRQTLTGPHLLDRHPLTPSKMHFLALLLIVISAGARQMLLVNVVVLLEPTGPYLEDHGRAASPVGLLYSMALPAIYQSGPHL